MMVYLDNGATTPPDPRVVDAMEPFFREDFGNPSSAHALGAAAARAVRAARERLAEIVGAEPDEIVFTSGGTEADNLAIRGAALAASPRRRHALLSALEHPAVRDNKSYLESQGFTVELVPCSKEGITDLHALEELVRPMETSLVAVMHANNEVGTIQDVARIADYLTGACPEAIFHVDAVQSFTRLPVRLRRLGATTIAIAAHKIHGPKGIGALIVKRGAKVRPILAGGGQERGMRPGTENVAGIVGFGLAAHFAHETLEQDVARTAALRDRLLAGIHEHVDDVRLNGHRERRLCNNLHISFQGVRSETLLHMLEESLVYVSAGSACHAGSHGPSAVLKAMGWTEHEAAEWGTIRFTLSRMTTEEEIDRCIEVLKSVVPAARSL